MRPVPTQYKMHFGFGKEYPQELKHLTIDGLHKGFDYLTPIGVHVIACVDGIVNFVGWKRGYGNCVYIKFWTNYWNPWNRQTYRLILAHLSTIDKSIKVGQKLRKTQICGLTGDSGMVSGPHLHLECQQLMKNVWVPIDPTFVVG